MKINYCNNFFGYKLISAKTIRTPTTLLIKDNVLKLYNNC